MKLLCAILIGIAFCAAADGKQGTRLRGYALRPGDCIGILAPGSYTNDKDFAGSIELLKEQEQREFDMIEEMDKFQKELEEEEKKKAEELKKQKEYEEIERLKRLEERHNRSSSGGSDFDEKYRKLRLEGKNGNNDDDYDDGESEEEDEKVEKVREKEYDFTDLLTKKYQKSDKKSEISSLPKASNIPNKPLNGSIRPWLNEYCSFPIPSTISFAERLNSLTKTSL